jgi:hypothetical protein
MPTVEYHPTPFYYKSNPIAAEDLELMQLMRLETIYPKPKISR